ncbi:ADP-ribosylation factor GTPase-activating AGD1 [Micractinium conductrix]|uniref:ADP-ribosylation factor GTPase-activating AGD1 n=1 Tax=Micractinium conductrix TaxID=554055 RepID=A0A2P6VC69_9CHLO|nr:ADP-ribosylation factor GTPase-activating AGD1 [Micractinium conductrix]|eukprot:PSC71679.1 ADP-ribosylation factor GTPase-activating AGD1 [Micractinium conductrix]
MAAPAPAAVSSLLFSDLQDSPLFRSKVTELDGNLERLKDRASKLTKSAKKYAQVLDGAALGTNGFADSLEAFCGEADEESSVIGGPTLLKFVSTFRELSSFQDLLRTQTEVVLCERLNHDFIKLTSEVKESKRRLDKRSSEYDAARLRHLGHRSAGHLSTWAGKSSDPDKSFAELQAAKGTADEARFEVARRFTQMESNKRFEFLESMVTAVDAHLRYFERGYQLFSGLEPYLQHALQLVEKLKAEGEVQQGRMEALILQHKAEATVRDSMVGEAAAAAAARDPAVPVRPSGPLQMTAGTSQLANEMELYIRQTQESKGQTVTVLKQGYLLKQTSDFRKAWKRRFFVLDSQGMLYYYSTKEGSRREQQPRNTCSLLTATIKPSAEDPNLRYAFRVVSPEKEYVLQAENEVEQQEWMQMLQGVIACLLSGAVDHEAIPTRPVRPTHSRTISSEINTLSLAEAPLGSGPLGASLSSARLSGDGEQASPSLASISEAGSPGAGGAVAPSPAAPPMQGRGHSSVSSAATTPAASLAGVPAGIASASVGRASASSVASLGGGGGGGSVLEVLRAVPGNSACCDCGSPDPDWASLNLGVLMCIECSGVHRRLGVHVSKVRSCTLDTKVWEPPVLGLFRQLGNTYANAVWEGQAAGTGASAGGAASRSTVNPWSADSDDSEAEEELSAAARRLASAEAGPSSVPQRPGPGAPLADKERWIVAKYGGKAFLARPAGADGQHLLQEWLWDAVQRGDIRTAYRAIACGADVNHAYTSQPAAQLVWEANMQAGGGADQPLSPTNLGHTNVLHAACRLGDPLMVELLLQSGAQTDAVDVMRRTPLMYSVLYDHPEPAKLLLKRGAACTRDRHGLSPAQLAHGRPCSADSELMALLSRQQ